MEIEEFKKLKKILNDKIKWDEETVLEAEQRLGKLYQEVLDILSNQQLVYNNLLTEKDSLYGKLFKEIKYESDHQWDNKGEIDSQIKNDKKYYDLCIKCNQQAVIVDYLDGTLKNISSIGYQIRDFIKWKMFLSGRQF